MGISVGIDLGTTYSAVAMIDKNTGRARIIPNKDGNSVIPSVVYVGDDDSILIGQEAKDQQEFGSENTAAFFKRSMGDPMFHINLHGHDCTAVTLSAMMLKGLVEQAEEVSGEHIDSAYITVPAYFKNSEREATLAAAKRAKLNVLGLLNEPTAAAFAYGLNGKGVHQTVLIYDLGGGTFDVTLAKIDEDEIRILGSDGDHKLGGKDWDTAVTQWIIEQFQQEFDVDISEDTNELSQIAVLAERAKKRLSQAAYADITVSYNGDHGKYRITREIFDDITNYRLKSTSDIVDRLFASVTPRITWQDIDGVVLVGGSTRMAQVHDYVERMSGKPPLGGINVDEAVALGAAIRANQNSNGISSLPMLGGSTSSKKAPLPVIGSKKITDATAHALGMISESKDGREYFNNILIPKNSPIPAHNTKQVELRIPSQGGTMEVYLLQGGEHAPLDNEVAGKYVFTNIENVNNSRLAHMDVTYSYDDNGVIQISAIQKETGRSLVMHREPVPEDMDWVYKSPNEIAKEAKKNAVSGEVYLFIDMSGSMSGDPIKQTIVAANDFIKQIDVTSLHVGLVGFGDRSIGYLKASNDLQKIRYHINKIKQYFDEGKCGYGNENNPLSILPDLYSNNSQIKLAIILTDGVWDYENQAIYSAERAWSIGIDTVGIGIGSANEDFLQKISSMRELSQLTDLSGLSESFSNIARAIS